MTPKLGVKLLSYLLGRRKEARGSMAACPPLHRVLHPARFQVVMCLWTISCLLLSGDPHLKRDILPLNLQVTRTLA